MVIRLRAKFTQEQRLAARREKVEAEISQLEAFVAEQLGKEPTKPATTEVTRSMSNLKTIYLAGGCFWGVQTYLDTFFGIEATECGYANGTKDDTNYKEVKTGQFNFAEVVKVDYDPSKITYADLIEIFFELIDPTLLNEQGVDKGVQYRTGIYVAPAEYDQVKPQTTSYIADVVATRWPGKQIVTEFLPLTNYVSAEEYHQKYHAKGGVDACGLRLTSYQDYIDAKNAQLEARFKRAQAQKDHQA